VTHTAGLTCHSTEFSAAVADVTDEQHQNMAGFVQADDFNAEVIVRFLLNEAAAQEPRRQHLTGMLHGKVAFISFVTVAELLFRAESRGRGQKKRDDLDARLRAFGVLDPTRDTAELWARTKLNAQSSGKALQPHDLWIAAACLEHELALVSADTDFDQIAGLSRIPV
jgi:predicted nucleic acid-binding protein